MLEETGIFLAFVSFAFVTSITPGPNNLMVMASGAAFGWRRSIPHMAGIALGFAAMIGSVVLGLGAVLLQYPQILSILQIAGAIWLIWLAWQLAKPALRPAPNPARAEAQQNAVRPLRFHEAAIFQWVNPKAWTMAIAASSAYSAVAPNPTLRAFLLATTFMVIAPLCNSAWILAGQALQRLMTTGNSARFFSLFMAVLVIISAGLILMG